MRNVAILIGGGLGDAIWDYFYDKRFVKLLSIKEKHDLHVTCYVHSLNDQVAELLRYNPHIQDVYREPYRQHSPRLVPPLESVFDLSEYADQPMPIYLSPAEEQLLRQVTCQGDYVVIHPFAGEEFRSFDKQLPGFIHTVVKRGFNVVIVGGSHNREGESLSEYLNIGGPGIANTVNQIGVRLSTELVRHAKYFIGTHSCYQMAAWAFGVPSLCIVPDDLLSYLVPDSNRHVRNDSPYVTHLFRPENRLMFFSQFPHIQRFLDSLFGGHDGFQRRIGGGDQAEGQGESA